MGRWGCYAIRMAPIPREIVKNGKKLVAYKRWLAAGKNAKQARQAANGGFKTATH